MAKQASETDDADAIFELFSALTFDQKRDTLKRLQDAVADEANKERQTLLSRLAELDALTGKPAASAPQHAGAAEVGRARGKAPIKYYDRESGNYSTGRGSPAKWLQEKKQAGINIDTFLVGPENPLPSELASQ